MWIKSYIILPVWVWVGLGHLQRSMIGEYMGISWIHFLVVFDLTKNWMRWAWNTKTHFPLKNNLFINSYTSPFYLFRACHRFWNTWCVCDICWHVMTYVTCDECRHGWFDERSHVLTFCGDLEDESAQTAPWDQYFDVFPENISVDIFDHLQLTFLVHHYTTGPAPSRWVHNIVSSPVRPVQKYIQIILFIFTILQKYSKIIIYSTSTLQSLYHSEFMYKKSFTSRAASLYSLLCPYLVLVESFCCRVDWNMSSERYSVKWMWRVSQHGSGWEDLSHKLKVITMLWFSNRCVSCITSLMNLPLVLALCLNAFSLSFMLSAMSSWERHTCSTFPSNYLLRFWKSQKADFVTIDPSQCVP